MVLSETQRCPLFYPLISLLHTSSWPLSKFQWLYLSCWVVANAWTFIHLLVWKIGSNTAQAAAAMWGVEQIKVEGLWETGGERGGGRRRGTIRCTSVVHKQNAKLCFFSLKLCIKYVLSQPSWALLHLQVWSISTKQADVRHAVAISRQSSMCVCVRLVFMWGRVAVLRVSHVDL